MISVFDFIRAGAIVVGLGYTAQQDRKAWIWGDSVLWGAYSLGLFLFPSVLFPGYNTAMLTYVTRVFASHIIGMEAFWYLTRKTKDDNVIGATLWTRLINSLSVLILLTYSYSQHMDKFTDKTLYFDILAFTLLLLTTVFQFWRGEYKVGGREQKGNVSTILRVIFLIMFLTGILNMTFPTWVMPVKKLEMQETLVMRLTGALLFGGSFTALYASSFRYDEDRSFLFQSHIAVIGFAFVSLNLAYFVDGLFDPQQTLMMHLGMLPAFLVLLGMYLLWRNDAGNQTDYSLRSKS